MTRFYDGRRILEIEMKKGYPTTESMNWGSPWGNVNINSVAWSSAWEGDFFDIGSLQYNNDLDAYEVDDIEYLMEQADDWKNGVGDFEDQEEGTPGHTPEYRQVIAKKKKRSNRWMLAMSGLDMV